MTVLLFTKFRSKLGYMYHPHPHFMSFACMVTYHVIVFHAIDITDAVYYFGAVLTIAFLEKMILHYHSRKYDVVIRM